MEIKYLQTFKVILESGTFAAAARKLNYTQSTVTFQMQQLEQELGIRLFEKIGRRMVLSEQGKTIVPLVDEILETSEKLQNIGRSTAELAGNLRVAAPESLVTYRMQPVLKVFKEQAPNVKLFLKVLNCYAIKDYVMAGNCDLGIHFDVGGYASGAVLEELKEHSFILIACPEADTGEIDMKHAHGRLEQCLLISDSEAVYQHMFDRYCQEHDILFETRMELGSIEVVKRSVMSGLGIAYLPEITVREELDSGKLKQIKTPLDARTIKAACIYHKNKIITAQMELFINLLKEHV